MPNPVVTVLMAVFNGEKCLKPTIESILGQTFSDFEFVIVDDGSTDKTVDFIKSYEDPRIVLHENMTNMGQTKSLNVGLRLAKGKYIARTDAGDFSLTTRLEKQVKYLENNSEVVVLGTSAFRYNENGRILNIVHMPVTESAILQRMFFTPSVIHVSVLVRKKTIVSVGGYDEKYPILADYDLWSRLLQENFRLVNLEDILVGYMLSPDSVGAINAEGRSVIEASKIIKCNVNNLAGLPISLEQASSIYNIFSLNKKDVSLNELTGIEELYISILKNVFASKNDIHWFFVRKYLRYLLNSERRPSERSIIQYMIKSVIRGSGCFMCLRRLREIVKFTYDNISWQNGNLYAL
jgi:glycosyltransferase involved in cell wall biosynthesis